MKKIIFNILGISIIIFFFGSMMIAMHYAYKERNDPNTTPERRKEIDDSITGALLLMG